MFQHRNTYNIIIVIAIFFGFALPALADFTGAINQTYSFRTKATDPGDQIQYEFNWGDGAQNTWPSASTYVPSGQSVNATHAFTPANNYQVFSVAVDDSGARSGDSNIVTANIQPPGTPGQPCQTTQVNNWNAPCVASSQAGATNGTFTIAWTASDPHLNTSINQYIVQRVFSGPGGAGGTDTLVVGANHGSGTSMWGMNDTPAGTGCYTYQVQAEDSVAPTANLSGISPISINVTYDTLAPAQMSAPSVQGTVNGFTSDTSPSWDFAAQNDNGSDECWDSGIVSYNFKITTDAAGDVIYEGPVSIADTGQATYTHTQVVSPSGTYYGFVQALDRAGNLSPWSPAGQVTITAGSPPTAAWDYCSPDLTNTIQFADQSQSSPGNTINYWLWDFDDGNTSNVQNPLHSYIPDTTPPPDPTCTPTSQRFNTSVQVSCSDVETGVIIRYTTDGSNPIATSPPYTAPLTFTATTILKVNAWDAAGNQSGVVTNTYTLNEAPLGVNDAASTPINTAVTINVPANDSDVDGTIDTTTVVIAGAPSNGGTSVDPVTGAVTYTPTVGWSGTDMFTYTIKDNEGKESNAATVTVTVTSVPSDWWNIAWKRRRQVTFNNSAQAENLTDFPVLIKLNAPNRVDYNQTQDQGQDLRFVDAGSAPGATPLAYEIETWNETGDSLVWVKVPQIASASTTDHIWMYYGHTSAQDCQTDTNCPDAVNVWSNNYRGVWHLNETTGQHQDATSNNNDSSVIAVTTQGSGVGKMNGADVFASSAGNNIDMPDSSTLDFNAVNDAFTVEAWVKTTATNYHYIVNKKPDSGGYYQLIMDGGLKASFSASDGADSGTAYGVKLLNDNAWHYVVGTWSGTYLRVYADGVQEGIVQPGPGSLGNLSNNRPLVIGEEGDTNRGAAWDGTIDEVRISSKGRTGAWIAAQYQSMQDTFIGSFGSEESIAYGEGKSRIVRTRKILPPGMYVVARALKQDIITSFPRALSALGQTHDTFSTVVYRAGNRLNHWFAQTAHVGIALAQSLYNVTVTVQDTGGGTDTSAPVTLDFTRSCAFSLVNVSAPNCHSIEVVQWSHANAANQYIVYWDSDANPGNGTLGSATVERASSNCNVIGCTYSINNLEPSTAYYVYIRAQPSGFYNNYGACTGTQSTPCAAIQETPLCGVTSVNADTTQCGAIILSWDPVDGADGGYELYRELDAVNLPQDPTTTTRIPLNSSKVPDAPGGGLVTNPVTGDITLTDRNVITRKMYYYRAFPFNASSEPGGSADVGARNFCFEGPTFEEK